MSGCIKVICYKGKLLLSGPILQIGLGLIDISFWRGNKQDNGITFSRTVATLLLYRSNRADSSAVFLGGGANILK